MYEYDDGRRSCRLRCDVCGDEASPWWPSAARAVPEGLRAGWEIVFRYHGCPRCTEQGRIASDEWVGDVRVTIAE